MVNRRQAATGQMRRGGRGGKGGGTAAPATPAQILGAAYIKEHRASDPTISLNGSNVTNWPDYANNGALTQGTASLQPPFGLTSFNGGRGVSGTATRWIKGTLTSSVSAGTRLTVWIVFKFGSDNGKTVFSLFGSTATFDLNNIGNTDTVGIIITSDGTDTITGPPKDTNPHLVQLTMRATGTGKFKVDDVAYDGVRTGTINTTQTTPPFFSDNGSRIGNSTIAHFVMMLGVPTAQQETDMRTFFKLHPDCLYYGLTHTP